MTVALVATLGLSSASAHVKWFSAEANSAMDPQLPLQVLASAEFLGLGMLALVVMVVAGLVDHRLGRVGTRLACILQRIDAASAPHAAFILRVSLSLFFVVSLWYFHGHPVYLTPELHTHASWVPFLQALIAIFLLVRRTAWLGALGIGILYAAAMRDYGWFHLLDYPVFLGAAACVAMDAWRFNPSWGLLILRLSAGITLMWAGGEKWLYPSWSDGLLDNELHALRGSLSNTAFMAAAGWIEFCAAFALILGRVTTQIAAGVLLIPFVVAIPVFGPLDAIGHAPIIVVLYILGTTANRLPSMHMPAGVHGSLGCVLAAVATLGAYWLLQGLAYGRVVGKEDFAMAVLMVLPVLVWFGLSWRGSTMLSGIRAVRAGRPSSAVRDVVAALRRGASLPQNRVPYLLPYFRLPYRVPCP